MLRPWQLTIQISRDSTLPIHAQIAKAIVQDIKSGRLTSGTALPGSRLLANNIQVNRKTVIQAYEDLVAQGWLKTHQKRGTFVSDRRQAMIQAHQNIEENHKSSEIIAQKNGIYAKKNEEAIFFSESQPDSRLIPFEMLSRVHRHALISVSREPNNLSQDALGLAALRKSVLNMLNIERGLHAKLNQICILPNSQMCLYMIAKTLVKEGDFIIFETLSCPNARETFKHFGATLLFVNHDEFGIDTDQVEQLCIAKKASQRSIKAVYVTPNQHIPTTISMSTSRKNKLIELAERYGFTIIEDDAGFLHQFGEERSLPIASQQHHAHIIYFASLSQALSNCINTSFIVGEQSFINKCADHLMRMSQQDQQVTQLAMSEILRSGQLKKHLIYTQKIYATRKMHLKKLIEQELGFFVSIHSNSSGLAFWLNVFPDIRMDQLTQHLNQLNVMIQTGKYYAYNQQSVRGLLMGFANLNEEEAKVGIKRMKQAFLMQQNKQLLA